MITKMSHSKGDKRFESIESLIKRLATRHLKKQKEDSEQRVLERIRFDNKMSKFE